MKTERQKLEEEAEWLNREHKRLFGVDPSLSVGCDMLDVELVRCYIFRHYVEEMKLAIAEVRNGIGVRNKRKKGG